MFRQTSNHCTRVLEAVKFAYATKIKLGSWDFWQIPNSVLHKGKSAMPPPFNSLEVLPFASDKAKLFAKKFSYNSNFNDSSVSLPGFPSRTNLKLHNISIIPKMVKKVITNLIHQGHLVLIVFQWWFWRSVSLNLHICWRNSSIWV